MNMRTVASRRLWCLLLTLLGLPPTRRLMRKRFVLGALLLLLSACFDGGPFAPRKVPSNPCHPGQWYEVEQDLTACPTPNR
jgi:hypothetical protein